MWAGRSTKGAIGTEFGDLDAPYSSRLQVHGGFAMRLCRFRLDDLVLVGFFADDRVIPVDQAAEAYGDATGNDLDLPSTENLLDLLPPHGVGFEPARLLSDWVDKLDEDTRDELSIHLDDAGLLVPIAHPRKILLLAGNYAKHVIERGGVAAERAETFPYVFLKPPTTLTNPGDPIVIPRISPDHIDWECELGVVMGATCSAVAEADALRYVAGYTVVNDISDRKFTPNPSRKARERDKFFDWQHGKWHDTFCPVGPCIASADALPDPQLLRVRLTVNGHGKQDGSTAQMIFPVAAVIAFISSFVTLEAGDIISTGTPDGVGSATGTYLKPGDLVSASVSGIGELTNPVVAQD
jgi:2-keto-4-pentenoate hydratase/2-oxohepta-3-ene-1,7-dioic acid hydratase in catechol pathway